MGLFRNHKTKKERRPRSLFQSLCVSMASIVLSLVMLVGTTMAWFTDETTSSTFIITSGTVDSTVSYATLANVSTYSTEENNTGLEWSLLPQGEESNSGLFAGVYQPGNYKIVFLKLENSGTLPACYRVSLQMTQSSDLAFSEKLRFGYKVFSSEQDAIRFASSGNALAKADTYTGENAGCDKLSAHKEDAYQAANTTAVLKLLSGESSYLALSIFMPEETNTTEMMVEENTPKVEVRLTIIASQLTTENVPEPWDGATATATEKLEKPEGTVNTYNIKSPADLAGIANILNDSEVQNSLSSVTINLITDIDMNNEEWKPINTTIPVTINGNGHTIYNLNASGEGLTNAGLFGSAQTLTVTSLNFVGGQAIGTNAAGMLAGTVTDKAELTAVNVENVTVQAPSGYANPLVGTGMVTQDNGNASNYTINIP